MNRSIPPSATRGAVAVAAFIVASGLVAAILVAGYLAELAARHFPLR